MVTTKRIDEVKTSKVVGEKEGLEVNQSKKEEGVSPVV